MFEIDTSTVWIIVLATLVMYVYIAGGGNPGHFPPGPIDLPFVGTLYRMWKDPFDYTAKMASKNGTAVTHFLGKYKVFLMHDFKLIKEAFDDKYLQGRPALHTWRTKFRICEEAPVSSAEDGPASTGILHSLDGFYGHHPDNQKIFLKTLQDFGPKRIQPIILEEVEKLYKLFDHKEKDGRSIDSKNLFEPHTRNILWKIMAGRKLPEESDSISTTNILNGLFGARKLEDDEGPRTVPYLYFPILKKLAPKWCGWTDFIQNYEELTKIVDKCVEDHRRDQCKNDQDKDFVDLYLDEIIKCIDPSAIFFRKIGMKNLICVMGDLLIAGVDPTAATLNWAMALSATMYQDSIIMDKIRQELDRVVGKGQMVTLEHRPKLVYLNAFINEVMRFRPAMPWGIPHECTSFTRVGVYNVQWTSWAISNLFGLFKNPKIFPAPEEFKPERFLSEDGKEGVTIEEFIPFSIGLKKCPGESLARDQIFLMMGNILKRYQIFPEDRPNIPSLQGLPQYAILRPKPFEFMLVKRFRDD